MQQRVVNALALVGEPGLVIADEPTSGLDADLVDTTAAQLLEISERGAALLVITHDLRLAERLGGRLALLYASRIVEVGPTAAFFAGADTPVRARAAARAARARGQADPRPAAGADRPARGLRVRRPLPGPPRPLHDRPARPLPRHRRRAREVLPSMLSADSIVKRFGRVTAVDGVSLALEPGVRLGLVGPSGSGQEHARPGPRAAARGTRPRQRDDRRRARRRLRREGARATLRHRVQLVFQAPRLSVDPRLRLEDAILEPLAASGLPRALGDWPERVGLTPDLLRRFPHEVSEGQLQRACLARALIVRPRYLICDELSSMLDVSTQAALLETIAGVERPRRPADHPRPRARRHVVRRCRRHRVSDVGRAPS